MAERDDIASSEGGATRTVSLVEDSGDSLDAALAEEERSARRRRRGEAALDPEEISKSSRTVTCASSPSSRTTRSEASGRRREYFKIALAGFAHDFLPILDNFERALAHARRRISTSDFGQGVA